MATNETLRDALTAAVALIGGGSGRASLYTIYVEDYGFKVIGDAGYSATANRTAFRDAVGAAYALNSGNNSVVEITTMKFGIAEVAMSATGSDIVALGTGAQYIFTVAQGWTHTAGADGAAIVLHNRMTLNIPCGLELRCVDNCTTGVAGNDKYIITTTAAGNGKAGTAYVRVTGSGIINGRYATHVGGNMDGLMCISLRNTIKSSVISSGGGRLTIKNWGIGGGAAEGWAVHFNASTDCRAENLDIVGGGDPGGDGSFSYSGIGFQICTASYAAGNRIVGFYHNGMGMYKSRGVRYERNDIWSATGDVGISSQGADDVYLWNNNIGRLTYAGVTEANVEASPFGIGIKIDNAPTTTSPYNALITGTCTVSIMGNQFRRNRLAISLSTGWSDTAGAGTTGSTVFPSGTAATNAQMDQDLVGCVVRVGVNGVPCRVLTVSTGVSFTTDTPHGGTTGDLIHYVGALVDIDANVFRENTIAIENTGSNGGVVAQAVQVHGTNIGPRNRFEGNTTDIKFLRGDTLATTQNLGAYGVLTIAGTNNLAALPTVTKGVPFRNVFGFPVEYRFDVSAVTAWNLTANVVLGSRSPMPGGSALDILYDKMGFVADLLPITLQAGESVTFNAGLTGTLTVASARSML